MAIYGEIEQIDQGTLGRLYVVPSSELSALYTARRIWAGELGGDELEKRCVRLAWEQLLSWDGSEVYVKPAPLYWFKDDESAVGPTFREIEEAARRRGEVAIGISRNREPPVLNPADKETPMAPLSQQDHVVVISKGAAGLLQKFTGPAME